LSRPRILIVTRKFWPQVGSAERALGRLVWGLGERFDVKVATAFAHPQWPRRLDYGPVRVERIYKAPTGWFSMRGSMRTLTKYISDARPEFDLIYSVRFREESAAVVKAACTQIPVVVRAEYSGTRGDIFPLAEDRRGEAIRRECTKATRVVTTSPYVAKEVTASGMPRDRIVEISCDAYSPDSKPDNRDIPATTPDDPTEVSIGRRRMIRERIRDSLAEIDPQLQTAERTRVVACLEGWQDPATFDFLLETALTMAAGPGRPVRFWLIGDQPLSPWILRRMNEGEVRALFAFMPLVDNIDPLLTAADAVIVPSCDRFSPLSLIEAIESQTPLVCIDRPEIDAIIGDTDAGAARRYPEGDITAAMTALEKIISDELSADALIRSADSVAAERFGLDKNIEQHAELFQTLIDENTKTD